MSGPFRIELFDPVDDGDVELQAREIRAASASPSTPASHI
jgi:hypothetical protein